MKSSSSLFALVAAAGLATLAASNVSCSTLERLLSDGGGPPVGGSDGGGTIPGGDADGGGGAGAKASLQVTYNVTAMDLNGKMGSIIARVKACGTGGAVNKTETLAGQTLMMGTPIMLTISDLDPGMFCLRTYLDVNGNMMQDSGDIVPAMEETMITLTGGMSTAATVDLAMAKP